MDEIVAGDQRGWTFTPLDGKKPTLAKWQKAPRPSIEDVASWIAAGHNVGLRTGAASGVVVVDIDPDAGKTPDHFPPTLTAITGRGGWHLYYRHDGDGIKNSVGRLDVVNGRFVLKPAPKKGEKGTGIDVRSTNGQVVFVGSVHPETKRFYQWLDGRELADMPPELVAVLADKPRERPIAPPTTTHTAGWAHAALRDEIATVIAAVEGTRNHTLNTAAFNLGQIVGGGALSRGEVEAALYDAAQQAGLGAAESRKTISSGIAAGIASPRTKPEKRESVTATTNRSGGKWEEYVLTPGSHVDDAGNYLEVGTHAFASAVVQNLPDDKLYRRGRIVGNVIGESGLATFERYTNEMMRRLVDRSMRLGKWTKQGRGHDAKYSITYQTCSRDHAGLILDDATFYESTREIVCITPHPVYTPKWKLIKAGWNEGGYFYDEPADLANIKPERNVEAIHATFDDLLVDFPWKAEADRQNLIGLMLTLLLRPAVRSNVPMGLILASKERTGKSKLAETLLGIIATGRRVAVSTMPANEDERDKRVLALLMMGRTYMVLDNVAGFMDSPVIAALLTSATYRGRMLGVSQMVELPNNMLLVMTGNNVRASSEIVKRCLPIQLQPFDAHPDQRTNFVHADLESYVAQMRRKIFACLIGMVENWLAAKSPRSSKPFGGFEGWAACVGGVMETNGFDQMRENEAEWRSMSDPVGEDLQDFVRTWWSRQHYGQHGAATCTAAKLVALAVEIGVFGDVLTSSSEKGRQTSFSRRVLRPHINAPVSTESDGDVVIRATSSGGQAKYYLEPVNAIQL